MKLRLSIQHWGIILALFLAISIKTDAQTWHLFKKNDGIDCKYFTTDNLCDIYIITNKNEIIKFDDLGYFEGRYANKKMGNLASVDATNPFKLLLFYPDFQTITLLDRLLNPISSLVLSDYGIRQAKCVCASRNAFLADCGDAFDWADGELSKTGSRHAGVYSDRGDHWRNASGRQRAGRRCE